MPMHVMNWMLLRPSTGLSLTTNKHGRQEPPTLRDTFRHYKQDEELTAHSLIWPPKRINSKEGADFTHKKTHLKYSEEKAT